MESVKFRRVSEGPSGEGYAVLLDGQEIGVVYKRFDIYSWATYTSWAARTPDREVLSKAEDTRRDAAALLVKHHTEKGN